MLFKKEQKINEDAGRVASTLSKVKEIGYTDYFSEKWPGELSFSSYSEISKFLVNTALFGDEKLFVDSVGAIKSVLYNNPDHPEAGYLKFICREFSSSAASRSAALGLSVMLEVPDHEEPASLLESARAFFSMSGTASQINDVGTSAAILIMLQNGSAEDRKKAFESLPRCNSATKYEAIMLMDTSRQEDLKALGSMLKDQVPYVSKAAADKLYSSLSSLGAEGFDAIATSLFEAIVPKLLSSRESENSSSIENQAGLLVAATMYASPKSLERNYGSVASLLASKNNLAFGAGYSMAEKLLARSLIQKSSLPEGYMYKTKDLEFFRGAYSASAKSIGMPLSAGKIYRAYLENIERMFKEGIISKRYYKNKLKLRADFERREKSARNNSAMLFGILNARFQPNSNARSEKSTKNVSAIDIDEYELFKTAIDSVMISEIKWQSKLNDSLKKASTLRSPYRAYWNMLRLGANAHWKASKEAYSRSETSGIFESYILEYLKALNLYSRMDRFGNRLYLMHETDPNSRLEAMENLAKAISENNKKLVEIVGAYCKEHGVVPNEDYTKEYEALVSANMAMIKELRKTRWK